MMNKDRQWHVNTRVLVVFWLKGIVNVLVSALIVFW